jgi:hypothetical protein
MNKIIYVVFFMVHMCIYYRSLHLYIKDTDVSYFKQSLSSDKPVTKPTLDDLYALMNTNYVKEILEPFSSECTHNCIYKAHMVEAWTLIPLDKIVKDDPNYYVMDDENNKRIINIDKSHIQLNRGGSYYENTFYIVGCIWEWEHVSIQSLSQHCLPYRPGIMEEGRGQDHSHSHYIIQDVIYPRYVFHTLHK